MTPLPSRSDPSVREDGKRSHDLPSLSAGVREWERYAVALRAENERLRGALQAIADEDYRGYRSTACQIAHAALSGRTGDTDDR